MDIGTGAGMAECFIVQSYSRASKGGLRPDIPLSAQDADHARRIVDRLSGCKALVIAFMREAEAGEAKLIEARGEVPDEIQDMPRAI